jgi:pimeloyl-ACP methyl ester carboxylesterase
VVGATWAAPSQGRSVVEGLEVLSRLPAEPAAPPILFVHGAAHAAWCWDEHWLPAVADRGYPAYALSLRGRAGGDGALRGARLADYERDVWQVLIRLPARAVLVGHSMGALLVTRILQRYPAHAGALLAPPDLRHGFAWGARIAARHPWDYVRGLLWSPPLPRPDLLFAGLPAADADRLAGRMVPESKLALLQLHGTRRLRSSTAPLLVMGGAEDAVVAPVDVVRAARHYGTRAHLFRGMGHDLMLDRGWETPLAVLLDWLDRTVPRRPGG